MFNGDFRQILANDISDKYEGLLHQVQIEYFKDLKLTLCYLFNIQNEDVGKLFPDYSGLVRMNATELSYRGEPLQSVLEEFYFLLLCEKNAEKLDEKRHEYRINNFPENGSHKLFENMESILDYRTIVKEWNVEDRFGKIIRKSRTVKKYCIWIQKGYSNNSIDFDTIDELKHTLVNEYRAQKLVPIVWSPWDTTHRYEDQACKAEDLTLMYLLDKNKFEADVF